MTKRKNPEDLKVERHGLYKTSEYKIWGMMKDRCLNPHNISYSRYGGRGIKVCEEWQNSFMQFLKDVGNRPSQIHSLDRINNDGNYEPNNVRWAIPTLQSLNQRQRQSKTGYTGVWFKEGRKKPFAARLKANGQIFNLGYFETALQASEVYKTAKLKVLEKIT